MVKGFFLIEINQMHKYFKFSIKICLNLLEFCSIIEKNYRVLVMIWAF